MLPEKRGEIDSPEHAYLAVAESESKLNAGAATFVPAPVALQGNSDPLKDDGTRNSDPMKDDGTSYITRAQAAGGCTAPAGVGVRRGGSLMLILALVGCFCVCRRATACR